MNNQVFPATLGGRVRFARELRGLGVNELDRLIGVHVGYVSKLENGGFEEVGSGKLAKIGEVLRVNLDWLVRGLGRPDACAA